MYYVDCCAYVCEQEEQVGEDCEIHDDDFLLLNFTVGLAISVVKHNNTF